MSSPETAENEPQNAAADAAPEVATEAAADAAPEVPTEAAADVAPEVATEAAADAAPEAAAKPAPKPRPAPKPGSFGTPSPAVIAAHATHPVLVPVASDVSDEELAAAAAFGVVDGETVKVTDGDATHEVGEAKGDEPITPYVRAYFELKASIDRFLARLQAAELSPKDIDESLGNLRDSLAQPKVVGDLAALRAAFAPVEEEATAAREAIAEARRKAREEAIAAREAVVARAEEIAGAPIEKVHWKNDTAELRSLLDSWKEAQRSGARIPKDAERELWKRFTHARTSFEKARKHHFAEVDGANTAVAQRKEALVERAEAIQASGDFERGAREFRDLMNEWRNAGRGRRSVDDALWKRFQGAQDAFFEARRSTAEAEENALAPNVDAAEAAVKDAESLLPIKDLSAAKQALRAAQDRFESAGRLPRAQSQGLAKRLGAVERAVRDAESEAWNKSNPEVERRVSGLAAQLHDAIAELEAKLANATTPAEKKSLKESLDARKAWLKQIEGAN